MDLISLIITLQEIIYTRTLVISRRPEQNAVETYTTANMIYSILFYCNAFYRIIVDMNALYV